MKKSIIKRLIIKLSRGMGYEIIDQSDFNSPTLHKELNEDLSIINEKSIVLPLGEVKITKKVSSVLIIFRTNTDIEIWDQNKKRLFEEPKIEYSLRALKSLIISINFSKTKYPKIKFKTIIVLNLMFGYFVLEKLTELIKDFKALKEYSIFGCSNNLLLF